MNPNPPEEAITLQSCTVKSFMTPRNIVIAGLVAMFSFCIICSGITALLSNKQNGSSDEITSDSYLPHYPGTSREYVRTLYAPDGSRPSYLDKYTYKDNGIIETTTLKYGLLDQSKFLLDGGEIKWLDVKPKNDNKIWPEHHRINGDYVEIGHHYGETDKISWEPVIKVNPKKGDEWEWEPMPGSVHTSYTICDPADWHGKPAIVVREMRRITENEVIMVFNTYAKGIGLVESDATYASKVRKPQLGKQFEFKYLGKSK